MTPYIAAVVLAVLVIAAITGLCCPISREKTGTKKKEQKQGTRRDVAVKGGIAVRHQENGYFLKNMQQMNTIHLSAAVRERMWKIILRDVRTNKILFNGSFSGELLLGRGKSNDGRKKAVLHDPEISKEHCLIFSWEDGLYLMDLHSKNHTYLNGKLVTDTAILRKEDIISLGNVQIQVFFGY